VASLEAGHSSIEIFGLVKALKLIINQKEQIMNHKMKLKKAQAWPIVKATFPNYKGRTFHIEFTNKVTFFDTNWGGGSRNSYAAVRSDGKTAKLGVPAPWINPVEGKSIELPEDVLVVEHSIFCGKDCGITIYANTCHLPKWLSAA
jgi:hypothetical protein